MQKVTVKFKGTAWGLFILQLVYGFLTLISFGLLLPLFIVRSNQWYLENIELTIEEAKDGK